MPRAPDRVAREASVDLLQGYAGLSQATDTQLACQELDSVVLGSFNYRENGE